MEAEHEQIEVKCPFCHLEIRVLLDRSLVNLIKCPYEGCKEYLVRHPDNSIRLVIPVIPDLTKEIQPIDYERLLTQFDYELAFIAKIKL